MNSRGSTDAPTANTAANTTAAAVENTVTRHATDLACASVTGAERRPDQRLRGDRQRIQHQRKETPQLQHHLVGGDRGRAEPRRNRGRGHEAGLERQ